MTSPDKNDNITGFKMFYQGLVNQFGQSFKLNQTYKTLKPLKWGHAGFHMCLKPEDCFRYFDTTKNTDLAIVKGSGTIITYDDEYNGYYDMYVCEKIKILKVLTRKEILNIGLTLTKDRLKRYITTLKLNNNELAIFKEKFKNDQEILTYLAYYQENDKDAFVKRMG